MEYLIFLSKLNTNNILIINASSNAISLLNILGHNFEIWLDYENIKIPFADLRNSSFQNISFKNANLNQVDFSDSFIQNCDF